ncbi:hypothetical protein GCM10009582_13400 [Arthrobacter flavus]
MQSKFLTRACLLGLATVMTASFTTVPAVAVSGTNATESLASSAEGKAILDAAPEVFHDRVTNLDAVGNGVAFSTDDGDVTTVPTTSDLPVVIGAGTTSPIEVALPFPETTEDASITSDDSVIFDHGNGASTVPVVKLDGSVQITTVIESPEAPTEYQYVLTLPAGGSLQQLDDGGIFILDQNGDRQGVIAPPWAKDANGKEIATSYLVEGNVVTQTVAHTQAEGLAYPVIADPWLGQALIASAYWSYDPRGFILNITPTGAGRRFAGVEPAAAGWNDLIAMFPTQARQGRMGPSMREQYYCHVYANFFEPNQYNLETWRPYSPANAFGQLNPVVRCNPT